MAEVAHMEAGSGVELCFTLLGTIYNCLRREIWCSFILKYGSAHDIQPSAESPSVPLGIFCISLSVNACTVNACTSSVSCAYCPQNPQAPSVNLAWNQVLLVSSLYDRWDFFILVYVECNSHPKKMPLNLVFENVYYTAGLNFSGSIRIRIFRFFLL